VRVSSQHHHLTDTPQTPTHTPPQNFLIAPPPPSSTLLSPVSLPPPCSPQVRDREGAQQDLTAHCLAYKRRELAAMLGGSSSSSDIQQQQSQEQPDQQQQQQQQQQRRAFGMLLFSCNGRGMSLYDEPSWDSRTLAGFIPVPCSGFMCNGERRGGGMGGWEGGLRMGERVSYMCFPIALPSPKQAHTHSRRQLWLCVCGLA